MKKENIKPVVLMLGASGVGKTTIAQNVLGKNIVSDDKIDNDSVASSLYEEYTDDNITIYDSLVVNVSKGDEYFIDEIKLFVNEKDNNTNKHINMFWYVIAGSGGRVTDSDIKIINTLPKESVIVVISKKDIAKMQQLEAINQNLINNGIENSKIIAVSESGDGIEELKELTHKIFPKAVEAISKINLDTIENKNTTKQKLMTKNTKSINKKHENEAEHSNSFKDNKIETNENIEKTIFYLGLGLIGVTIIFGIKKIIDIITE